MMSHNNEKSGGRPSDQQGRPRFESTEQSMGLDELQSSPNAQHRNSDVNDDNLMALGACALNFDEDTELKSSDPGRALDDAPDLYPNSLGNYGLHRAAFHPSAIDGRSCNGCGEHACSMGDRYHDVSLNRADHILTQNPASEAHRPAPASNAYRSVPPGTAASSHTASSDQSSSTVSTSQSSHTARGGQSSDPENNVDTGYGESNSARNLAMNIPPINQEPRITNSDVPIGMAERQPSFRTTSTVASGLPAMRPSSIQGQPHSGQQMQLFTQQDQSASPVVSSLSTRMADGCSATSPHLSECSNEDNTTQNLSVTTLAMTARPVTENPRPSAHANVQMSPGGTACATPAGPTSHGSRSVSMRSFIPDNILVRLLPRSVIRCVAVGLEVSHSSGTWKDLVENYGWTYIKTFQYEHQSHRDGIFCSLLMEPEFQDYTLDQLRHDLFIIPRRDLLHDLNEKIEKYNSEAQSQATNRPASAT